MTPVDVSQQPGAKIYVPRRIVQIRPFHDAWTIHLVGEGVQRAGTAVVPLHIAFPAFEARGSKVRCVYAFEIDPSISSDHGFRYWYTGARDLYVDLKHEPEERLYALPLKAGDEVCLECARTVTLTKVEQHVAVRPGLRHGRVGGSFETLFETSMNWEDMLELPIAAVWMQDEQLHMRSFSLEGAGQSHELVEANRARVPSVVRCGRAENDRFWFGLRAPPNSKWLLTQFRDEMGTVQQAIVDEVDPKKWVALDPTSEDAR